jgi:hypothetical protein
VVLDKQERPVTSRQRYLPRCMIVHLLNSFYKFRKDKREIVNVIRKRPMNIFFLKTT